MITKTEWARFTDWVLARSTQQPANRRLAWAVVGALMTIVGVVDYWSGIRASMSVFYFIPVTIAVAWFGWRIAVGVAVVSVLVRLLGDWAAMDERMMPLWSWWNSLAMLAMLLILVWIFDAFLMLYRRLEIRVAKRTAELVKATRDRLQLEQELLLNGSRERNLFGQELHDDVCQHLVGTAFAAKVLARRLSARNDALAAEAQAIVGWIEQGAHKARNLARGLLLSTIDPDKLGEELKALAEEGSASGMACRFRCEGDALPPDASIAAQLFRIAQEALRNALKHSAARHVEISLVGDRHAICLMVEDDGCGLPAEDRRGSGIGLRIMSHRAAFVGATLSLISADGQGTRVICRLPKSVDP